VVVPVSAAIVAANILKGAGDESHDIARMWLVAFGLAIFVYVVVGGAIVWGALRKPKGELNPDGADSPLGAGVELPDDDAPSLRGESRVMWIGGIIGPAIILAILAVLVITTTGNLRKPTSADLVVQVQGAQWYWDVAYPAQGFETANEIHLPVDQSVDVQVTTADVIHSFWVPDLAGKLDAIPGQVNHLRFTPQRVGTFRGFCAEFCGQQHAHMGFLVIVQSQADFGRWVARETRPPSPPESDAALRGAATFERLACAGCHSVRGTSAVGTFGPDLSDFGQRRTFGGVIADNTPQNLAQWIADAPAMKPGVKMPAIPLTPQQTSDIVAYLESLN
jgi:cytochrome c oxidase subunit 2